MAFIVLIAPLMAAVAFAADAISSPSFRGSPQASPSSFTSPAATDERLLVAIRDRLALMPLVAAVKWKSHKPVGDPAREAEVLAKVAARATELGLDGAATRALFELQIRLARDLQIRLHVQWKRTGQCPPCEEIDGLARVRERIDTINEDILLALYLVPPLLDANVRRADLASAAETTLASVLPASAERRTLIDAIDAAKRTGGAKWSSIRASGVLRIGTTGDYAPFTLDVDGVLQGADIALALDLAKSLGLRPVFVRTAWPALTNDLSANRFDVALSGISHTPERAAIGLYSDPYHHGGKTILARCNQRSDFETVAEVDRPGVRVVVNPGGTNERYVRSELHRATILVHADNPTTFDEILAHRADVMITDDVEADLQSRRHPELCRTTSGTLTKGDKRVLMARDDELHAAVNSWLAAALAAGVPQRLLQAAMNDASNTVKR